MKRHKVREVGLKKGTELGLTVCEYISGKPAWELHSSHISLSNQKRLENIQLSGYIRHHYVRYEPGVVGSVCTNVHKWIK